ncbi:hypothetical protein ACRAQ6_05825 [Erythrobacter sp. HA6-11]
MIENFTENYGWIEIAFFYSIALGFAAQQIWKMDREIKKDKAKAAAKKAEEEAAKASANSASDEPKHD